MLLSITEKCRMGCSHCMDDARADCDKFMTKEMFEKAVDFNFKYDKTIGITGGEPTEHPLFWEFMEILVDKAPDPCAITIMTNGMNLSDADIDRIVSLQNRCKGLMQWQVTNVTAYYPKKIDKYQKFFSLPNVYLCTSLEGLVPRGRAADHPEWKFNAKAPQCFNLRSIMMNTHRDLFKTVTTLRYLYKFCTPQISYEGHIKLGESTLCPSAAHIDDSEEDIVKKICDFRCSGCKTLLDKLPARYREAIGED